MTETRQNSTALPRATLTRWLCVAVFLLLSGKSTALEIAGHGGSASWTQIGATFTGSGSDNPGSVLSFSEDGSRLLVGSANFGGTVYADVYEWQTGSSAWTLLGARIVPPHGNLTSACLSGDGNVVAIGDFDGPGPEYRWTVAVYHYASGSWQRVGSDIVGSFSEGYHAKVSLSSDGKVLAVGNNDETYVEAYNSQSPGSTPGGSTYGDCECFCDDQRSQYAGFIEVCDQNGGPCGILEQECYQYGPQECANKLGQACSDYYPNWMSDSTYTGSSIDYSTSSSQGSSGQTTPLGDCECMCDDASWSTQTWINKVDCPSGQVCPASEAMCSDQGPSACEDMNTNNQYCSSDGVVSTAWIYVEAYHSSTPGPGGYGDCQCICDGTYAGDIPVTDGQGGKGMAEAECTTIGAEYCENIFSSACQSSSVTVTVNWAYDSTYDGANMDFSGSGGSYGGLHGRKLSGHYYGGPYDDDDHIDYNATMTGRVRIYQWPASDLTASGVAWTQMGETIEVWSTSSGTHPSFGPYSRKVYLDAGTLSGDGKRVAVFHSDWEPQEDYVYEWKSSTWSVVGDPIPLYGAASVSYDGNVVAGAWGLVYKWSSGAWSMQWLDLGFDYFSASQVSLSRDGTRVAIGDAYAGVEGGVVVHQWNSDAESWGRMVEIRGEPFDEAGARVSLSGDGSRVAVYSVGPWYSDGASHTRVFEVGTTCDTSVAPPNATVGNCPAKLASGSSCQPTCSPGYGATNPTTCVSGYLKNATCTTGCDISSAPANGGKGDCSDFLAKWDSCTPTCNDGYVRKGNKKTRCDSAGVFIGSAGVLSAAECRKRYSWGDAKFCPKYENVVFCWSVKKKEDCLAARPKRDCKWSNSSSGGSEYCYHDDKEFDEMWDESYYHDFAADKCGSVDPWTRDACVAVSGCDWSKNYGCAPAKESVKKILSDTGAPPGVSSYWNGWWHDACWYLTKSTCTTSTTVAGCVLNGDDECEPSPAKAAVYGADGCAGHADFEAVAALGGTTVAEAREKFTVKSAKEQAEETRDSILAGITDESLKRKAKLLADAAIGGNAVKKLTAKLEAATPNAACALYYSKASIADSLGACVATAAAGGRRRRLAAAVYDVEVFFSSAEVDDDKLTKVRDALKAEGIEATLDENVDPIAELKTIDGVDASAVDKFKTQSTAAAAVAAAEKKPPPPPPPPSPPPKLVVDDEDATPRLGAGSAAFASACAFLTVAMFA